MQHISNLVQLLLSTVSYQSTCYVFFFLLLFLFFHKHHILDNFTLLGSGVTTRARNIAFGIFLRICSIYKSIRSFDKFSKHTFQNRPLTLSHSYTRSLMDHLVLAHFQNLITHIFDLSMLYKLFSSPERSTTHV